MIQLITPRILVQHLSLIAPSSVSNSVKDGGTFCGPQFFTFSSAKSHENCLHFKVAPVINDKKHPKHLVVTGALHVIQWIWGPQNHPSKSLLWMRQLKKCAGPLANECPDWPASCKWLMGGTGFLQMIIRINHILLYFSFYSSANLSFSKNNIFARLASICNFQHCITIAVCKYTALRYLGEKSQPTFKVNSFLKVA